MNQGVGAEEPESHEPMYSSLQTVANIYLTIQIYPAADRGQVLD